MLEWIGLIPLLGLTGNWRGYRMGGKAIGGANMSTDMKKKFEAARAAGNMDQAQAIADKTQKFNDDKKAEKAKAKEAKTIADREAESNGSRKIKNKSGAKKPPKGAVDNLVKAYGNQIIAMKEGAPMKSQQKLYDLFQRELDKFEKKYLNGERMNESNMKGLESAAEKWISQQAFRGAGKIF